MKYFFFLCTCIATTVTYSSNTDKNCPLANTTLVIIANRIPRSIKIDDFQQLERVIKTEERNLRNKGKVRINKKIRYALAEQIAVKKLLNLDWPLCCWQYQNTNTTPQ